MQRASNDRKDLSCVFCVRQWPRFALIFKFSHDTMSAHFDRKIVQFRGRKCAQHAPNARRHIPKASVTVPHILRALVKVLQPLRTRVAQKLRQNLSNFLRFSPSITSFDRKFCGKHHRRGHKNLLIRCSVHRTIVKIFRAFSACVSGRDSR